MTFREVLRQIPTVAPLFVSGSACALALMLSIATRHRDEALLPRRDAARSDDRPFQDGILPLTARAVSLTGRRAHHNDALFSFSTEEYLVAMVIDGVGDRPSAAAAGLYGAAGVIALANDQSVEDVALAAIYAADAAYRGPLGTGFVEDRVQPRPAAAAAIVVVDSVTGEFAVAWAGDVVVFIGRPDGTLLPLNRAHNPATDPECPAHYSNPSIVTRCLGDPSPSPLPPERCTDTLHQGESLIIASDGTLEVADAQEPFWWRRIIECPPSHAKCPDNATLLVIEPAGAAPDDPPGEPAVQCADHTRGSQ